MNFRGLYSEEKKLMRAIENEKGFSWNKLFKIIELNALISQNNIL